MHRPFGPLGVGRRRQNAVKVLLACSVQRPGSGKQISRNIDTTCGSAMARRFLYKPETANGLWEVSPLAAQLLFQR